jgi:hypothetical protein
MNLTADERTDVEDKVVAAVRRMMAEDDHLLLVDCSEMAIVHRIGVYLEDAFEGFDVDCEYNRALRAPKRVQRPGRRAPSPVLPDLVVHGRGGYERSLLVLEAKKKRSEDDLAKLRELLAEPHRYAVAAFLLLRTRREGSEAPIGARLSFSCGRTEPFGDAPPPCLGADWFQP